MKKTKLLAILITAMMLCASVGFAQEAPAVEHQEPVKTEAPAAPAPAPKEEPKPAQPEEKKETPVVKETIESEPIKEEPVSDEKPAAPAVSEEPAAPVVTEAPAEEQGDTIETPVTTEAPETTEEETVIPEEEAIEEEAAETPVVRYTVRFLNWNDDEMEKRELSDGDTIAQPDEEPTREGWTFSHWYLTDDEEKEPYQFGKKVKGASVELKAFFSRDEEIVTIQEEEIPLAGPNPTIKVSSSLSGAPVYGMTIILNGELSGFEGLAYTLQWQYNDGNGWHDASGATESAFAFNVTQENHGWSWRLIANIQ